MKQISYLFFFLVISYNLFAMAPCPSVGSSNYKDIIHMLNTLIANAKDGHINTHLADTYNVLKERCENNKKVWHKLNKKLQQLEYQTAKTIVKQKLIELNYKKKMFSPEKEVKQLIKQLKLYHQDYKNFVSQKTLINILVEGKHNEREHRRRCSPKHINSPALGDNRDQTGTNWCFAYTAADLISYKIGKKISTLSVVTTYYHDDWAQKAKHWYNGKKESEYDGGNPYYALKKMSEEQACLEKDLPSSTKIAENIKLITTIKQLEKDVEHGCYSGQCYNHLNNFQQLFKSLKKSEILAILKKQPEKILKELVDKNCAHKSILIPDLKIKELSTAYVLGGKQFMPAGYQSAPITSLLTSQDSLFSAIDGQLNQNNLIGVNYSLNSSMSNRTDPTKGELHSATIVGRRYNPQTKMCEYQIRNHTGKDCSMYKPEIECKNGNYWLSRYDLAKSLFGVVYIEQ